MCGEIGFGLDLDFGYVMELVWVGLGFLDMIWNWVSFGFWIWF